MDGVTMNEANSSITQPAEGKMGVILALADLPADAVVTEQALAAMLHKHLISIKRAVKRGELPVPVRLFGERVWTVQALREHTNRRLEQAKRDRERQDRRISQLSA